MEDSKNKFVRANYFRAYLRITGFLSEKENESIRRRIEKFREKNDIDLEEYDEIVEKIAKAFP